MHKVYLCHKIRDMLFNASTLIHISLDYILKVYLKNIIVYYILKQLILKIL